MDKGEVCMSVIGKMSVDVKSIHTSQTGNILRDANFRS